MKRPLTPIELGDLGEGEFQQNCGRAKLVAEKSRRDRTGWDYLVEWPNSDAHGVPLDSQLSPISCHVQVKTMWAGSRRVKMRLSSANRLAKELKPAFLYVLWVDEKMRFQRARVIHVSGDFLALILRELRQVTIAGAKSNQSFIRFDANDWGEEIALDGIAFRTFVERQVAGALIGYAQQKDKQLASLGYEEGRYRLQLSLPSERREEFLDAMLGLQPVEVDSLVLSDVRFDLAIPRANLPEGPAKVEIGGEPAGNCRIRVRAQGASNWREFHGRRYLLPEAVLVGGGVWKAAIRTELFDLKLRTEMGRSADLQCTMTIHGERVDATRLKAEEWREFLGFLADMDGGVLELGLKASGSREILQTITVNPLAGSREQRQGLSKIAARMARVMRAISAPGTKLTLEEMCKISGDVGVMETMMSPQGKSVTPLSFRTAAPEGVAHGVRAPMLHVRVIQFGENAIVHCEQTEVVAEVADGRAIWTGANFQFIGARRVRNRARDLDAFLDDMTRRTGVDNYVMTSTTSHPRIMGESSVPDVK